MKTFTVLLCATFLFTACLRVDDEDLNLSEKPLHFAQMEVTVLACNPLADPFCEETDPIPGARIFVYETEEERHFNATPLFEGTTGSAGKYTFNQLTGNAIYYLRILCSNEIKETTETTPGNGIAYHEILCIE